MQPDTQLPSRPALPWHAGEQAMQQHAGSKERMADVGPRVIRDHLIDQHRLFYPLLPYVVLGAVDPEGNAWATLRAANPGFMHSPDAKTLRMGLARDFADPAERGFEHGDAVGLLGIQLQTRRRNRANGVIRRHDAASFEIGIQQSYGNCPQYIQVREPAFTRDPSVPGAIAPESSETLDDRARRLIANADTFFVASYVDADNGARQVDVSHRGGRTGFVRVGDDGVLTVPDFHGNQFFNTLGNLLVNPRAGLVFIDFESGDLLQLTGTAEIVLDSPEIDAFHGAERLWRFTPQRVIHRAAALPLSLTFEAQGWSPQSLNTGTWSDSAAMSAGAAAPTSV